MGNNQFPFSRRTNVNISLKTTQNDSTNWVHQNGYYHYYIETYELKMAPDLKNFLTLDPGVCFRDFVYNFQTFHPLRQMHPEKVKE